MDDCDTDRDMDSQLRRLHIGARAERRQARHYNTRSSSSNYHTRADNMPDERLQSVETSNQQVRLPVRQTEWFDRLAYGQPPQVERESTPTESSSSSRLQDEETRSDSRSSVQAWHNSLVRESYATTLLPEFESNRHDHDQGRNSQEIRPHDRGSHSRTDERDLGSFADDELDMQAEDDSRLVIQSTQERGSRSPAMSGLGDDQEPMDTYPQGLGNNHHHDDGIVHMQSVAFQRRAPTVTSTSEQMEPQLNRSPRRDLNEERDLLTRHLDFFQRSCKQAFSEGIEKITNRITQLQDNIRQSQRNYGPARLSSRRSREVKLTGHPIRRSNVALSQQKKVRDHLARLLKNANPAVVEEAEARAFQVRWNLDRSLTCCTVGNFRIDLTGPPKSAWNQSASQIFAHSYCDFYQVPREEQQEALLDLAFDFLQKIRYLKSKQKTQNLNRSDQMQLAKIRRVRTRKANLFHRRLEAAERHPHLQQHVEILQRLGVDGMSSDESDYDELPTNPPAAMRAPRYYVLSPKWRGDSLGNWLETFDVVYNILRRESLGRRGAYARRRVQSSIAATRSQSNVFVPHLPINAYDETWMSGRRDISFSVVPTESYDFTHDLEVLRYMQGTLLEMPQMP